MRFLDEYKRFDSGKAQVELRVDYRVNEWGHKTPVFKLAPEPDNFTYPLDMLAHAAKLYMQSGEKEVPSIEDTLYQDLSWDTQVLLYSEGLKWARDTLKGN